MRIQPGIAVMLLCTILSSPTIGQEEATTETEGHDEIQAGNDDLPHYGGPEGANQSPKRDADDRGLTPFSNFLYAVSPWSERDLSHDPLDQTDELVRQHEGICRTFVVYSNQTN